MSRTPLYKKVKENIIHSLVSGEWQPGDMIPNEKQLAERFGVAISTVRTAIGELVAADVLERLQGKGTFVKLHGNRGVYRFFNLYQLDGKKASFFRQLIRIKKGAPTEEVISLLKLPSPDEQVFQLRLHLHSRNAIIAVSDLTVPESRFPDLDSRMSVEGDKSLYEVFQTLYHINVVRVAEQLSVGRAPAGITKALNLKTGEPLLHIRRIAYTFNDEPIEVRTSWVHTKDHYYLAERG